MFESLTVYLVLKLLRIFILEENRIKKSLRNYIYLLGNLAVNLILQFANRTIFIHTLGVSYLGINGLFSNVISLLNMVDLGLSTSVLYSFYKPLAEKDFEKINILLKFYKKIYYVISTAVFVLGMTLIPFLKYFVNLDKDIPNIYLFYIMLVINTAVSYLFVYKTCILVADQKQYVMTKYQIIFNVVRSILQIVALSLYSSYEIYLLILIITTIFQNMICAAKVDKIYPIKKTNEKLIESDKKELKNNIFSMFAYKIASQVFSGTDNIIISVLFGTISVGLYSNYLLIIQFISNIVGSIFSASTASVGNSIVVDSPKRRLEIFNDMQTISSMVGIFFTSELLLLINDFIKLWLGDEYVLNSLIVLAVVINFAMDCGFQPIWCFRNAAGIFVKLKYIMLVAAVLNIILSIGLGKLMGIPGVFFATTISRILSYFWYEPRILFKDFLNISERIYYKSWFKYVINLIITIVGEELIFNGFKIVSWRLWIVKATISSIISLGFIAICYCKSHVMMTFLSKMKKIIFSNSSEK